MTTMTTMKSPPVYGETPPISMSMEDLKRKSAAGKPPLQLLQLAALVGAARVREYGDSKYAPGNWLNAPLDEETCNRYAGAALRHLQAMQGWGGRFTPSSCIQPDESDPEQGIVGSGLPHIDHAIMSLVMLREILTFRGQMPVDPGQHLHLSSP